MCCKVHKTVTHPPLMEDAGSITQPGTSIFEVELCETNHSALVSLYILKFSIF